MSTFHISDEIEWSRVSPYDTTKRNNFYTHPELITIAKKLGIKCYSSLRKNPLAHLILAYKDSNLITTIEQHHPIPENSVYQIGTDCIKIVMLYLCDIDYQAYRSLTKVNKRFYNISKQLQRTSYVWKEKIIKSIPEMNQILDQTQIEHDTSKSNYEEIITTAFPARTKIPPGKYYNTVFDIWYRIFILGVKYCSQPSELNEILDLSDNDAQTYDNRTTVIKQRWGSYWRRGAVLPIHLIDFGNYINGDNNNCEIAIKNYLLPTLPQRLMDFGIITKINIVNCGLTIIPNVIFDMEALKSLDLSKNPLTTVQMEIKNLINLKQITLRGCSFNQFPSVLTELSTVTSLNISFNKFKSIPSDIQKMKNLENLNLTTCNLLDIPKTLVTLSNIRFINLVGNRLTVHHPVISFMRQQGVLLEI